MRTSFVAAVAAVATCVALAPSAGRAQGVAPDVVYHNGKIFTGNGRFDIVQALAARDGKIVAVGTDQVVRKLASPTTRLVDLRGKTVLPGFYDNHIHLGGDGEMDEWEGGLIDAVTPWLKGIDTVDALVAAISKHAASVPKGEWIQASIAREYWFNSKIPKRGDLDKASTDHPIVIARGPHTLILNSLALQKAGITRDTKNPTGGWLFHDKDGEPDGRVLESARRIVWRVAPSERTTRPSDDQLMNGYRTTLLNMARVGITSVNVAGMNAQGYRQLQRLYEREGATLPRATVQLRVSPGTDSFDDPELGVKTVIAELEAFPFRTGFGNDRLKVGALKMSIDGGLSAPDFWSTVPYKTSYLGPNFFGVQRIPADSFYRVAKRAHELGWQLGIHTIGDAAVVMVVDQLEKLLADKPAGDYRHYLHHVCVKPPEATLQKMAKLGIMVASQPGFTIALGSYAEDALEPEREQTQNPAKSLLDHGIKVSFGSDAGPYGPLTGIFAAVTRKGYDGKVRGRQEAITVQQAISLQTLAGAYNNFEEKLKGTLEVGKVADLVVLGEDILTVDPDRIRRIPIEQTIVGGRTVYPAQRVTGASERREPAGR